MPESDGRTSVAGVRAIAAALRFPEGPAVDAHGVLWAVELQGGSLLRLHDHALERVQVGGAPNGLAFRDGIAWFCDADGRAVRRLREGGRAETVVDSIDGMSPDRPNDLAFDRLGNLVFTCPGESRREPTGSVWCRRADGRIGKVADGLFFPNGLAFSATGDELVIAETYRHRLWRGGWDERTASWVGASIWCEVGGPIGPDGMAFDRSGHLHVAVFDRGEVAEVSLGGEVTNRLPTPGRRPTNVAFLPQGGMVVTEAERGEILLFPNHPLGASLFDRSEGEIKF